MARLHRLLIVFLLAWLPLQAVALPMLALHCESGHGGHAVAGVPHGLHAQTAGVFDHDHASPAHDGQEDAGTVHQHFCCHHFSALPVTDPAEPAAAAPALTGRFVLPLFSFFPEPQRRPPRA